MTELAVVVLAHADPVHLARLTRALEDVPLFVHCDARTRDSDFLPMLRLPGNVSLLPRIPTRLASWSLVRAELSALRRAVSQTRAEHIAVLTGSDYPLVTVEELVTQLKPWRGYSYVYNRPVPFAQWSTRRHPDGGAWRTRHRFLTWRDAVVTVAGRPMYWPVKRDLPDGLELRASSQWKIYSRQDAETLLQVEESRPDLIAFWRSTFIPEESFSASILSSKSIVGEQVLQPCLATPWYYRFPPGGDHPRWLTLDDFDELAEARWAPPLDPLSAFGRVDGPQPFNRKLFARKFTSRADPSLLDRVDAELRI